MGTTPPFGHPSAGGEFNDGDGDVAATMTPFVAGDEAVCEKALMLQALGLATRLSHSGIRKVVLGFSGGLDSTLALLVCREAVRRLGLPQEGIVVMTLPGAGTGRRTLGNVKKLCKAMGLTLESINIEKACREHLRAIGHDGKTPDVTFENAQARERTQILMDRANMVGALVVGTGDLSEIALGWCTFGGDHLSMYNVNAGVPKTLVREIVKWSARQHGGAIAAVLTDIVETPVSPELLPVKRGGETAQHTEKVVGPYVVHDFFLWHLIRCGERPRDVLRLAVKVFKGEYGREEIKEWLRIFITRFFANQWKRACVPDSPNVLGFSLSPRGGWSMPSDASADVWLRDILTT